MIVRLAHAARDDTSDDPVGGQSQNGSSDDTSFEIPREYQRRDSLAPFY